MDQALYLYHSGLNGDFALLSQPTISTLNITNPESYALFQEDPVAFVARSASLLAQSDDDQTVALNVFWSESRKDVQTTTRSLDDLNSHSGDYVELLDAPLGYFFSSPMYSEDDRLVPLTLVYSDSDKDAITSPFNAADVAALFNDDSVFRDTGSVIGWGAKGSCDLCNLATSETFPSAGGADCPEKCDEGKKCANAIYHVGKDDEMPNTLGGQNFLANMKLAGEVVSSFDSSVEPEFGTKVHVSFEYWCCYTDDELSTIKKVLDDWEWEPQDVSYDRAEVRIDNPNSDGTVSHYSICIFLDEESNNKMLDYVGSIEAAIEAAGVKINSPRKKQEPYHSTLAVVDGRTYPVEEALKKINEMVPPSTWTGVDTKLTLTVPDW
ncbi:hypothetical protein TL16_g10551 [Triparma laevis f. inornata]|uniref:Uncharacterized protein n=1 Tax=Triparma laevis f. inornata TaxID=1714386 RepID=A0A9W7B9R3_9STRA|nr:hypothetical protein TL16_g10551 [Triparma laevis f. inornata]